MNDLSTTPKSNSESIEQEQYNQLLELLSTNKGDPKLLQSVSEDVIKKYTDFLIAAKEYKNKIDQGEMVTLVEREQFGHYLEDQNRSNMNLRTVSRDVARLTNSKDIAYHKYLRMTRGKMPGYEYKFDRKKDREAFDKKKWETIVSSIPNQSDSNVRMGDVYINNILHSNLNMEGSSGYSFYKNDEGFNGLRFYLEYAAREINEALDKKQTYLSRYIKPFLLELRYMFEVADATHNTLNKKMLSEMIEFCESAVNTMQNDAFEKREEQRKNEIEINAVVEYCTRNNLKLDDIMALNKHIEKMKQESQLKDQSLSEMTQKMDDDEKNNKKTIQKYEGILANVITQAKKSPFGSDYKISQELISEIRQIIPVESITKSQK